MVDVGWEDVARVQTVSFLVSQWKSRLGKKEHYS